MRFQAQAIVQVIDVPLFVPPKKAEPSEICPQCGGPAEVDTFWSSSPDHPGLKVLKKQICCGGRRGRPSRHRVHPVGHCPVQVIILETEEESEAIAVVNPPIDLKRLDAAIELLALLDEGECRQLMETARLTRELTRRKESLKSRLQAIVPGMT